VRVLWLTANYHPQVGGIQMHSAAIVSRLVRTHEVHLLAEAGQGSPFTSGIHHHTCAGLGGVKAESKWTSVRQNVRSVLEHVKPDLVHFGNAGMTVYADLVPADIARSVTVHGNDATSPWQLCGRSSPGHAIAEGLSRCHIIAVSHHARALLEGLGIARPVQVISNGCDTERFQPRPLDRPAFLASWGIPPESRLVLTVSRLAPRKGHRTVLKALAGLGPDVHWVVVGVGDEKRRLVLERWLRGLSRHITLIPRLTDDELARMYNACDVFALTPIERRSRMGLDTEGFGLVFHEAGASGKPVVASSVSGCTEAVLHGHTGLLVPPGDHHATRAAIQRILCDPRLAERLGSAGRTHVVAQGGWDACTQRMEALFSSWVAIAGAQRKIAS
jgi:glycosyltransferase involved in cell wall biosynthesis